MISDITKIDIESIDANIPEGFELVESSDSDIMKLREYRNDDEYIIMSASTEDNMSIVIDNEQYNYESYYDKQGQEYMVNYSEEQGRIVILWYNSMYLYRISSNLEREQIFTILE